MGCMGRVGGVGCVGRVRRVCAPHAGPVVRAAPCLACARVVLWWSSIGLSCGGRWSLCRWWGAVSWVTVWGAWTRRSRLRRRLYRGLWLYGRLLREERGVHVRSRGAAAHAWVGGHTWMMGQGGWAPGHACQPCVAGGQTTRTARVGRWHLMGHLMLWGPVLWLWVRGQLLRRTARSPVRPWPTTRTTWTSGTTGPAL